MTLDELKTQKIWFLWNYAPGKNGKKTKVPMSATGGVTGTSDNFRNTWDDYDTAIRAKEKLSAAGIGFKVPDNNKANLAGVLNEVISRYRKHYAKKNMVFSLVTEESESLARKIFVDGIKESEILTAVSFG